MVMNRPNETITGEEPLVGVDSTTPIISKAILGKATMIYMVPWTKTSQTKPTKLLGEVIEMGDLGNVSNDSKIDVTPFTTITKDIHWNKRKFIDGLIDENDADFEVTMNYATVTGTSANEQLVTYTFSELFALVAGADQFLWIRPPSATTAGKEGDYVFGVQSRLEGCVFNSAIDSQVTFKVAFSIKDIHYKLASA